MIDSTDLQSYQRLPGLKLTGFWDLPCCAWLSHPFARLQPRVQHFRSESGSVCRSADACCQSPISLLASMRRIDGKSYQQHNSSKLAVRHCKGACRLLQHAMLTFVVDFQWQPDVTHVT